jgi:hypothetical protein
MKTEAKLHRNRKIMTGQALVILLFYMIIAITLSTTAVSVVLSNSMSVMREEQSIRALEIAEAGGENAFLRLVRDTGYAGETLTVGDGNATVTVTGDNTKTILSTGVVGTFSRTIQAIVTIDNGIMTITSWTEV